MKHFSSGVELRKSYGGVGRGTGKERDSSGSFVGKEGLGFSGYSGWLQWLPYLCATDSDGPRRNWVKIIFWRKREKNKQNIKLNLLLELASSNFSHSLEYA